MCDADENSDEHDIWARKRWNEIWSTAHNGQGKRAAGRETRKLLAQLHRRMPHMAHCAQCNGPAYPIGPCDCI